LSDTQLLFYQYFSLKDFFFEYHCGLDPQSPYSKAANSYNPKFRLVGTPTGGVSSGWWGYLPGSGVPVGEDTNRGGIFISAAQT